MVAEFTTGSKPLETSSRWQPRSDSRQRSFNIFTNLSPLRRAGIEAITVTKIDKIYCCVQQKTCRKGRIEETKINTEEVNKDQQQAATELKTHGRKTRGSLGKKPRRTTDKRSSATAARSTKTGADVNDTPQTHQQRAQRLSTIARQQQESKKQVTKITDKIK